MLLRAHISVPRETWIYLTILAVVIVGAILREINLLIILAGLMFGPLWISWHLIRATLRKLSISRKLPRVAFPGELIVVELTVENPRRGIDSWALVVQDRIRHVHFRKRSSKTAQILFPHVPAGGNRSSSYRCRLFQRGPYRLGPVRISTKVPVGLLRGDVTMRKADELLIYPQLGRLKGKWSDLVKVDQLGQRSSHRKQGPIEGDFYGLRGWRSGDSRRWIHWRSSAKRNDLVVRQFEQYRAHDFVVLLDLWPARLEGQSEDEVIDAIELAVSFVATVVANHCRHANGHLVLGVAGEKVQVVKGSANVALLNEALEVLAEARTAERDRLADLVSQLPPNLSSDDQIVIVTSHDSAHVDPARFGMAQRQSQLTEMLTQAVCIGVNDPSFSDLFELDDVQKKSTVELHHATND